ncbi:MAG: dTMP kinase [Rectinemataceae bacterium]
MHVFDTAILQKRFIVLEGLDGAGTTTQLRLLEQNMAQRGISCWATAEPTNLPSGQLIRRILAGDITVDPGTVAHLFAADRHEHVYGHNGIAEHAAAGQLVVSDRYVLSSLAYQGVTCGPSLPWQLNRHFPMPGLTFLFDLDPQEAARRLCERTHREIYEELTMQRKVRAMYQRMARRLEQRGWRIIRIDASLEIDTIAAILQREILNFLAS